jgi:hypothetical protein
MYADAGASSYITNAMIQSAALAEWELELVTVFQAGPYDSLKSANKCKIQMSNVNAVAALEEEEMVAMVDKTESIAAEHHKVDISANCQGVKWNKLTLEEENFSAKAVMDSYNTVHQRLDGGDLYLDNVAWKNTGNMLLQGGGYVGFVVLTWF